MTGRLDKTLADYLVIAVSPILIMVMVGSLVFFLVEIFYQGQYEGRLTFVLALFVMAAVLIGRISIELGTERASMYAMPLALLTALAIHKFVVAEGGRLGSVGLVVNLGLLGLIWWAAHQLVWDCTLIDETQDSSGQGLLQVAGLNRAETSHEPDGTTTDTVDEPTDRHAAKPERDASRDGMSRPWWVRSRDGQAKPHAPGVWIVYFSLAALPVFGLGQTLVPAGAMDQRRYVFKLLVAYVASGLGLLLTTTFLGLRRYLRQRRLPMPVAMAAMWIAVGAGLIGAILWFALLLPRPNPEYSWDDLVTRYTSPERKASRYAMGNEGAFDPRRDRARVAQDDRVTPDDRDREKTGPAEPSKGPTAEKGPGVQDSQGEEGRRANQGKPKQGESQKPSSRFDARGENASASSGPAPKDGHAKATSSNSEAKKANRDDAKSKTAARGSLPPPAPPEPPASQRSFLAEAWPWIAGALRWAFYGVIAVAVLVWLFRHGRQLAEEVRRVLEELRRFWEHLFGGKPRPVGAATEQPAAAPVPRAKAFADYSDPFATGAAERLSPDELVRYSFEALEAWAREQGCARSPDQTPHEFAHQVGEREAGLAHGARMLASLYCRAAYAPGTLPPADLRPLGQFWRQLAGTASVSYGGELHEGMD